jgi:serine/threonine-protein kinase
MTIDLGFLEPGGALRGPLFDRMLADGGPPARVGLRPGARVGPYAVVRELGRGGMAVVYLARRADGEFQQDVALKLILPDASAPVVEELFRHERQILAGLNHPHIARLLDGGRTTDGALWFAMEFITGERIDVHGARAGLDPRQRLELFQQVCDAVQFAHGQLLIHRDIKPSNILVTPDGQAKLLDFGIARLLTQDEGGPGERALTPGWASPEQRAGRSVGTASDVWQLGRLLERVMGAHGLGDAPTLWRTRVAPEAPSTPATEVRERQLSDPDLRAIVDKAKAEEPVVRYPTVAALAADLQAFLDRRPVEARGGGVAYRAGRWLSRHRLGAALAAAALAALIAMGVGFTVRLKAERDTAQAEAGRANAATSFLLDLFRVADPGVHRGETLTANEILASGSDKLQTELRDQPALRAALLEMVGQVHMNLGQLKRAEPMLDEAVQISRGHPDIRPGESAARLRALAQVRWRLGQFAGAIAACDEGLSLLDTRRDDVELRAKLLNTKAQAQMFAGFLQQSEQTAADAISLIDRRLGPGHEQSGRAWNTRARALEQMGRVDDAMPAYANSMRILRAALGPDHHDVYDYATVYGSALGRQGRYAEAMAELEQGSQGMARLFGTDSPRYAQAMLFMAPVLASMGRLDEALARGNAGLEIQRKAYGEEHPFVAYALDTVAVVESRAGLHEEALRHYSEALAIRDQTLPEDHIDRAANLANVGYQLCMVGRVDEGRRDLERAMELQRATLPEAHPDLAATELSLAGCKAPVRAGAAP